MNFAARLGRNSGRATPSLRRNPNAPTKETRQEATYLQREVVQTSGAISTHQLWASSHLSGWRPWRLPFQLP